MRLRAPAGPRAGPRIVCYYQTHQHNGEFVSVLPLLREKIDVTHVIVAAIHLHEKPGDITLNDDPYLSPMHDRVWQELRVLQASGVKILGMLGGFCPGTYGPLDGDLESFNAYYAPLRQMVTLTGLDGLDLDVEEEMSLPGIIRLIDRLKTDFGPEFLITLAPVAAAMQNREHMSGFNYEELEKALGHKIAWYNTQFYCGWGSLATTEDFDQVMARGWPPEKIVVGTVTNPDNGKGWVPRDELRETLTTLMKRHNGSLGGIMGWEYFNSTTGSQSDDGPWCWARMMADILRPPGSSQQAAETNT